MFTPPLATYAPVEDVRVHLREQEGVSQDDVFILECLRQATARIDQETRGHAPFMPWHGTRVYDALPTSAGGAISGLDLLLDAPLLAATGVMVGGIAYANALYILHPRNSTPAYVLRLKPYAGYSWRAGLIDPYSSIVVDGLWGYTRDFDNAWVNSGDTITPVGGVGATASTLVVADAAGLDAWGRKRFSAGQLLKADAEYMALLAVNATANTLTVARAQHGTTAAAHTAGTILYTWNTEALIREACAELAAYLFKRAGRYEDTVIDAAGTAFRMPKDLPARVVGLLSYFKTGGRILAV